MNGNPKKQEFDYLGFPRYYKISDKWYDLHSATDIDTLPIVRTSGRLNGKLCTIDFILRKKAEQYFDSYHNELRHSLVSKHNQYIANRATKGNLILDYVPAREVVLNFVDSLLVNIEPASLKEPLYYDADIYVINGVKHNLRKLLSIKKIKVLKLRKTSQMFAETTRTLAYILRMKASSLRKENEKTLSYACIRKSNDLLPYSGIEFSKYENLRIVRWLVEDGMHEEAELEEKKLRKLFPYIFDETIASAIIYKSVIDTCKHLKTDLVEVEYLSACNGVQAKYRGRIFSISGKNKKFPKLESEVINCGLSMHPFILGVSEPMYCKKGSEIKFSNRPFVDDRTSQEKEDNANWQESLKKNEQFLNNRNEYLENRSEYFKIKKVLPEHAPKSIAAYIRLKDSKSFEFDKLVKLAKEKGAHI